MKHLLPLVGFLSINTILFAQNKLSFPLRGFEELHVEYNGQVKNGKANGKGKAVLYNGTEKYGEYEGEWVSNYLDGHGTFFIGKTEFKGFFEKSTLHDPAYVKYENGDVYIGALDKLYNREGKGVYYFANGNKYIGTFKSNIYDGTGKYITNGLTYDVDYLEGKLIWKDSVFTTEKNYDKEPEKYKFGENDYPDFSEFLKPILRADSFQKKGVELRTMGKYKEAIRNLDSAVQNGWYTDRFLERSITYRSWANAMNDLAEKRNLNFLALLDISNAIRLNQSNSDYYFERAMVYKSLNQEDLSLEDLDMAIKTNSWKEEKNRLLAYQTRADFYKKKGLEVKENASRAAVATLKTMDLK